METGMTTPWKCEQMPDLRPVLKFCKNYFDLNVEGVERLPRRGKVVMVANHGGWLAFDGVVVASIVYDRLGPERVPIGFVEDILFRIPLLNKLARRLGTVGISEFHRWKDLSKHHDVFGIFPEGTEGNCKPLSEAYRTQEFRRGFVRLALSLGAQVVPVSIVGSDETFPVLYKWRSPKALIGSIVPVPMCMLPLPVRWKVTFHEPLDFSAYDPDRVNDSPFCRRLAQEVQGIIQAQLDREVLQRGPFPLALSRSKVHDWVRGVSPAHHPAEPSVRHPRSTAGLEVLELRDYPEVRESFRTGAHAGVPPHLAGATRDRGRHSPLSAP